MSSVDADKVVSLFRAALTARSAATSGKALAWFDGVDVSSPVAARRLAERLLPDWRASAELGVAFYRLYAALLTGRTVDSPLSSGRQRSVTFRELVADFERAAGRRLTGLSTYSGRKFRVDPGLSSGVLRQAFEGSVEDAVTQFERRARRRADSPNVDDGPRDGDRAWYAGVAQQVVANGARDMATVVGSADSKLIGWVRVSGSGRPCYFCAMLISRGTGWRPYRSKRSATKASGGGDYHPNCKCFALPVYSESQFESSAVFAQNRQFEEDWGVGGGSLNDWRKFYDKKYGVKNE